MHIFASVPQSVCVFLKWNKNQRDWEALLYHEYLVVCEWAFCGRHGQASSRLWSQSWWKTTFCGPVIQWQEETHTNEMVPYSTAFVVYDFLFFFLCLFAHVSSLVCCHYPWFLCFCVCLSVCCSLCFSSPVNSLSILCSYILYPSSLSVCLSQGKRGMSLRWQGSLVVGLSETNGAVW